ncbi:MAG: tRNA (adenosine(37)-N6)-threonylcarbamoyltransferase complex dimerization subunit type 1 TsaB [Parvibaculales bacterium]
MSAHHTQSQSPERPVNSSPRLVLACDTSQQACSVALRDMSSGDVTALYEEIGTGHAEILPQMLQDVLQKASCQVADLDALGVTIGPGTFAGVRVGLAAMRAFALVARAPIYTLTSLALMAQTQIAHQRKADAAQSDLACLIDARRGQVYTQCFDAAGASINAAAVLSRDEAADLLTAKPYRLVGTGAALMIDYCAPLSAYPVDEIIYPNAAHFFTALDLGLAKIESKPAPLYLRPPDAALPKTDQKLTRQ